jgi:hypothetical protein
MHEATEAFHFNKQIIWPFLLLISLPTWIDTELAPDLYLCAAFIHDCGPQIRSIMKGSEDKLEGKRREDTHPTLFNELLQQTMSRI